MFCFVNWKYEEEAKSPAVPDDVGYTVIAEPSHTSEYALLECDLPYDFCGTAQIQQVSEQLTDLLESAKQFPPALAIMRDEFNGNEPLSTRMQRIGADQPKEKSASPASSAYPSCPIFAALGFIFSKVSRLQNHLDNGEHLTPVPNLDSKVWRNDIYM